MPLTTLMLIVPSLELEQVAGDEDAVITGPGLT